MSTLSSLTSSKSRPRQNCEAYTSFREFPLTALVIVQSFTARAKLIVPGNEIKYKCCCCRSAAAGVYLNSQIPNCWVSIVTNN